MDLRLAALKDLSKIKEMYIDLIGKMKDDGIEIWDDIYPCESFLDDINGNRLYILTNDNGSIIGAFALCDFNNGQNHIKWEKTNAKALYLDRLGVKADCSKQGIGAILLHYAAEIAKEKSAEYLRLFVIDVNEPAINLYLKNDFKKAPGVYTEVIDPTLSFDEYGFEKKI